jgi:hypothetical protein
MDGININQTDLGSDSIYFQVSLKPTIAHNQSKLDHSYEFIQLHSFNCKAVVL